MIDFNLPRTLSNGFSELIPEQRKYINRLFLNGKLINYSMSLENGRMWVVIKARNKKDVYDIIEDLPLTEHMMDYEISELSFYHAYLPNAIQFSLN